MQRRGRGIIMRARGGRVIRPPDFARQEIQFGEGDGEEGDEEDPDSEIPESYRSLAVMPEPTARRLLEELKTLSRDNTRLKLEVLKANQDTAVWEERVRNQEIQHSATIAELKKEVEALRKENFELTKTLEEIRIENLDVRVTADEAKEEVTKISKELKHVKIENAGLKSKMVTLQREFDNLKESNEALAVGQIAYTFVYELAQRVLGSNWDPKNPIDDWITLNEAVEYYSLQDVLKKECGFTSPTLAAQTVRELAFVRRPHAHPNVNPATNQPFTGDQLREFIPIVVEGEGRQKRAQQMLTLVESWRPSPPLLRSTKQ
jgi:hypothetical protein